MNCCNATIYYLNYLSLKFPRTFFGSQQFQNEKNEKKSSQVKWVPQNEKKKCNDVIMVVGKIYMNFMLVINIHE